MSEGRIHVVPAIWPVDFDTAANPGDYVSMKGYNRCKAYIMVSTAGATAAVTALQAKDVAETGAKALGFDYAWKTGGKIKINTATGVFTVGETITGGTGSGTAVVVEASRNEVTYHTMSGTAFVDAETLTGGTSGYTAVTDGVSYDTDILCKFAVTSDTFNISTDTYKVYMIEFTAAELDVTNGFDCLSIAVADPGAAMVGAAWYVLEEPTFSEDPMKGATFD
jgi:hypothetical protein